MFSFSYLFGRYLQYCIYRFSIVYTIESLRLKSSSNQLPSFSVYFRDVVLTCCLSAVSIKVPVRMTVHNEVISSSVHLTLTVEDVFVARCTLNSSNF